MKRYRTHVDSATQVPVIVDNVKGVSQTHYLRPDYTPLDARVTVDWLNEREAGYPPLSSISPPEPR